MERYGVFYVFNERDGVFYVFNVAFALEPALAMTPSFKAPGGTQNVFICMCILYIVRGKIASLQLVKSIVLYHFNLPSVTFLLCQVPLEWLWALWRSCEEEVKSQDTIPGGRGNTGIVFSIFSRQ